MKRLWRWGIIALIWLVATLVLLEIGLRVAGPRMGGQMGVAARYVTTGQPYAEEWTRAWRENRDHYYTLRPDVTDALQYGSPTFSFRLTTHKLWDDGLPPDEGIGFRNQPVDYRVDAVVVGDSFGFCFTEQTDCWVDILAQQTGMGIVNLSQPVTGTISHAKMLADFGAPLKPPLVIWQFFGNDFNDDYGLLQWRGDIEPIPDEVDAAPSPADDNGLTDWLRHNSVLYALAEVITTGRWGGIPESEQLYVPQYRAVYGTDKAVMEFGKLYERGALNMSRPLNQFGLEQSREAFEASVALVESWDGRLVVVIIPTREEVYDFVTEPIMSTAELDKHRSARLAMHNLCTELDLTCIDALPELQERAKAGAHLYYTDDMHLNAEGNAALAQIIREMMDSESGAGADYPRGTG